MTNEIVRAITGDGLVKAASITGRDIVERARNIHKLLPMATAALGRTLMGASMMGDMLKEEKGALTLQIKGGGPLGTILAVSDHRASAGLRSEPPDGFPSASGRQAGCRRGRGERGDADRHQGSGNEGDRNPGELF